ncbi:MAG TPA: hypothetical protein EYP06_00780 [Desulfobacterales bacterium]|nr:hypothetical protein [Desulfobacterales bacterium]
MDNHIKRAMAWSKQKQGVKVIRLKKAEKKRWEKLLEPITGKWIASAKKKGLPADNIVEDIKNFTAMYAGK